MQETKTYLIDEKNLETLKKLMSEMNFEEVPVKSPYEDLRFHSNKGNLILYSSGKAVLQGKSIDDIEMKMSEMGILSSSNGYSDNDSSKNTISFSGVSRIGSDEVGKGDYFGPLVVASCYLNEEIERSLSKNGIVDSKKRTDEEILDIFTEIHGKVRYAVDIVTPAIYNEIYPKIKNASILLSQAHSRSIDRLVEEVEEEDLELDMVVIDQFSRRKDRVVNELTERSKKYKIEQFHRGESDRAVAAASIIARTYFLKEWNEMEKKFEMDFPKGATNVVQAGKEFVKMYGDEKLSEVAKVSFKTTDKVLS